jgi:hypothetical protein
LKHPYLAAKVLLALKIAPYFHRANIPAIPTTANPASRLTPPPIPRLINMGREKRTQPAAKDALERSFAANNDAVY